MVDDKSLEHRMVLKWAKTVSRVLQVGTVTAIVVIAARLLSDSGEVKIWEIEHVPLKAVRVTFLLLTIAHVFTAQFFVRAIEDLRRTCAIHEQNAAYEDLLVEGGSYVSVSVRRLPAPGESLVKMSLADASTWVAHGGALAAVIAVLPWWWHHGLRWPGWAPSLAIAGIDLTLVLVNWVTGSIWATSISRIGTPCPSAVSQRRVAMSAFDAFAAVTGGLASCSAALLAGLGSLAGAGVLAWLIHLLILPEMTPGRH